MATLAQTLQTGLMSGDGDTVAVGRDSHVARTAGDAQRCWPKKDAEEATNSH
jgi:hypothetical protein